MLRYEFMRTAFLIGGLLAIIVPLIGVVVVFKRMSMIGDALAHTSLAGIMFGVMLGFNPLIIAILLSIVSALVLDFIQQRYPKYQEISIAIVMSLGIGVSAVLLNFIKEASNFNTFLFGSIVSIGGSDVGVALALSIVIIASSLLFYRDFFYIAYSEEAAQLAGVNVRRTNIIFTIITAITVSLASRIIGALVVSSLMVIPVAAAMRITKSYKMTFVIAIFVSILSLYTGLTLSYYLNLAPGGVIVLSSLFYLGLSFSLKNSD